MLVKIKRQNAPDSAPYWQSFVCDGPGHVTIAAVLDAINYTDDLVLEPLSKFPVVADLTVDRSVIYENLNQAKAYLDSLATSDKKHHEQQYSVAKCLKCGLCLEVCPNYHPGGEFFGAVLANESYLITSQAADKAPELEKNTKSILVQVVPKHCPVRRCVLQELKPSHPLCE